MSVMTAAQFLLPVDRPLTVADLDLTPDDGQRYELDDGVLVVSAGPMLIHERVRLRLEVVLETSCPSDFFVVGAPGVEMSEIQYRIPDLVVVRAGSVGIADRSVTSPPALVVEVASPSTANYDRNRKKVVYAEFGIPAYWIVDPDPDQPSITAFTLEGSSYAETAQAAGQQRFAASSPFRVEIVPADLIAGPWRRARSVR
jgi:Uma2 family endonuclease